jgi:hypothetical protein
LVDNYNTFKDFCSSGVVDGSILDKRTGNINFYTKFVTRRCGVFIPYYEKWYKNRKKHIPEDLVLTPLILAIWFADDGHMGNSCSEYRFKLQLSTDDFQEKEVNWLKTELEKICNEHFFICGNPNTKSLRIGSADSGSRSFIRVIDNFLPQSMLRKAIWRNKDVRFYDNQPLCFGKCGGDNRQIEKDKLKKLVEEGNTIWKIAAMLQTSKTALFRRLKKYDIEIPHKGFYMTGAKIGRPSRLL